jgi:hypothetical protein
VGFGKPPKNKRFVKGQSGNPSGRPKGSRNPATIIEKACRESIQVMINGKTRIMSKFEAVMVQLVNQAVAGDLRAIGALFTWLTGLSNFGQAVESVPEANEADSLVMTSIVHRIRQPDSLPSEAQTVIAPAGPSKPEEAK